MRNPRFSIALRPGSMVPVILDRDAVHDYQVMAYAGEVKDLHSLTGKIAVTLTLVNAYVNDENWQALIP